MASPTRLGSATEDRFAMIVVPDMGGNGEYCSPAASPEKTMKKTVIENPTEEQINQVKRKLQEYNRSFWETEDRATYVLKYEEDDEILGGIVFFIFGQWLEILYLWTKQEERHRGIGRGLLLEAEEIAKDKGCTKSFLNTFSFQARPFYEKHGYVVVYTQERYPVTNARYFLEKALDKESREGPPA